MFKLINNKGKFEKSSENPEEGNRLPQEVGSSPLRWVSGNKFDSSRKKGCKESLTEILSRHFLSFLQKSVVIYLQRCLFWSFETFCGGSSLRNNELHLLQVVSSFLDNTYFGEDARNCAVYKANKTLLPVHCSSKREWICKIPRGKNIKIFTICLLSNNLQHFSKWRVTEILDLNILDYSTNNHHDEPNHTILAKNALF